MSKSKYLDLGTDVEDIVRGNRPGSGGSSGNGDMRCVIGLRCLDAMRTAEVWEPLCLGVNRLDLRNVG